MDEYHEIDLSLAVLVKSAIAVWIESSQQRKDVDLSAVEQLFENCLAEFIRLVNIRQSDVDRRLEELKEEYEQGTH